MTELLPIERFSITQEIVSEDILLAIDYTQTLFDCHQRIQKYANSRMGL